LTSHQKCTRAVRAGRSSTATSLRKRPPDLLPPAAVAASGDGGRHAQPTKEASMGQRALTGSPRAGGDIHGEARPLWVCGVGRESPKHDGEAQRNGGAWRRLQPKKGRGGSPVRFGMDVWAQGDVGCIRGVRPGRSSLAQRPACCMAGTWRCLPVVPATKREAWARWGERRSGFLMGPIWVLPRPILGSRGWVWSTAVVEEWPTVCCGRSGSCSWWSEAVSFP
jgi:hypothetical protein